MQEIYAELTGIRTDRLVTSEELAKAKDLRTLTLPGRWETNRAVSGDIVAMVRYGLESDHYDRYEDQVRSLDTSDLAGAARDIIQPDRLVWIVVGDRSVIEDGIRELAFGELLHIDADGVLLPQWVSARPAYSADLLQSPADRRL